MTAVDLLMGALTGTVAGVGARLLVSRASGPMGPAGNNRSPSGTRRLSVNAEKRLERDLPPVLERVASGMAAGHSLQQSLATVSGNPDLPLAPFLASILTRVRAGRPLEEALRQEAARFRRKSIPLALFTMASALRSGGNLVESLHLLARVCRDRESLRRKIDSLTAQSRLQGIILALVPLFFLGALALVSPGSLAIIVGSPLGRGLMVSSLLLEGVGGWVIHRMVSKEVY